jgi:hypothetical protein
MRNGHPRDGISFGSFASRSTIATRPSMSAIAPIATVSRRRNETTPWANCRPEQVQHILAPQARRKRLL